MPIDFDWRYQISACLQQRKLLKYENHFIEFFTNVFSNTLIPNKSWFGTTKTRNAISLVTGRIYLAAYVFVGGDEGIWLLLDNPQVPIKGVEYKPVKSTINRNIKLTWLHSESVDTMPLINQSPSVWSSFRAATTKVSYTSWGKGNPANNSINEKIKLNDFLKDVKDFDELLMYKQVLDEKTLFCSRLTHNERLERLKNSLPIPEKNEVKTSIYKRNPDVVAEILYRAKGVCEYCGNPAPFCRDDTTPYLEVHHKIPLSEGGEDTVDNAIALCPNCHRHAHYGKATFKQNW